jgi:HD-GYP domain-containing protein (c-di-GMP phosphodiesterase class II)
MKQRFSALMGRNILVSYTVITFIVIAATSFMLAFYLSRLNTNHLVRTHIDIYPNLIQAIVKDHPNFFEYLESPPGTSMPLNSQEFLSALLDFHAIFRIKVWNRDGTILWSDKPELVGKNFRDNTSFQKAMRGEVNAEHKRPERSENVTEQGQGIVLEIYTPVLRNGSVAGVIELYEAGRDLSLKIDESTGIIRKVVLASGGFLYLLLFGIYYGAYSKQRNASAQLIETQEVTILALAYQSELHDIETGLHLDRTARYVRILAEELGRQPKYRSYLIASYITDLVKSAPLHDIGKVGVTDAILLKPGRLTDQEQAEMRRHCEYGARILRKAEEKLSFPSFLTIAVQLVMNHHERWDGRGYPQGLAGENIPLSARIMSLADVYDALRSKRSYKNALSHEQCVAIIREEKGQQFDPLVVEAFLNCEREFSDISSQLAD